MEEILYLFLSLACLRKNKQTHHKGETKADDTMSINSTVQKKTNYGEDDTCN